jgi:L-rhamnose-H+ transport protein
MSLILLAIIFTFIAGIMNGSFALPTKYCKPWVFENIWLHYAFWALLILPWISILILDPKVWQVYEMTPPYTLAILMIGGLVFGVGQICFALALNIIGFGLGFALNIGLGTGLGFLLPLLALHPQQIFTPVGVTTLVGLLCIILGLVLSYKAGRKRDQEKLQAYLAPDAHNSQYQLGVILTILAGLCSAGQNFTFALTGNMQQIALASGTGSLAASIIIWPVFLACSFIPYVAYMIYLHLVNDSFQFYRGKRFLRNACFAILMGVFWYGSLIFYSQASLWIGALGPVIAWPLFMVLIILTSNFWGWVHGEWMGCSLKIKRTALLALSFLLVAVVILAYSAALSR